LSYQRKVNPDIFAKFLREMQTTENKVFIPGALVVWCWGLSVVITYNRVKEKQSYRIYRADEEFVLPFTTKECKVTDVKVYHAKDIFEEVIRCMVSYFDVKIEILIDTLVYKPEPKETKTLLHKLVKYGLVPYSLYER